MQEPSERITTEAQLRQLYPAALERARLKTLQQLDEHCKNFISLSPFVCLGTSGECGGDVTPRGDEPGFVQVLNDRLIAMPDRPGNNRLDSLVNIIVNPQVALVFLIPGVDETLRVNGTAEIRTDSVLLSRWDRNGKKPTTALVITVSEAFFHCGKALIRSKLWQEDYKIERAALPPYGRMLKDQIAINDTVEEIQASIEDGYKNHLY